MNIIKSLCRGYVTGVVTSALFVLLIQTHVSLATWVQTWADEFDGPDIDDSKWNFEIGDGCNVNLCGWGNNELESYKKENAFIEDGHLVIEARKEDDSATGRKYTSSKLTTKNKGDWTYGKIEIRAKITKSQGIWPAIWMLPTDEKYGNWPSSGEIDIMENIGKEPTIVHATSHFGQKYDDKSQISGQYSLPNGEPFSKDYHIYSVEWVKDQLQYFVDGVSTQTTTRAMVEKTGFTYPFDQRFFLVLNVAVGGFWPGNPDDTTEFPQRMEVDYVRVYEKQ